MPRSVKKTSQKTSKKRTGKKATKKRKEKISWKKRILKCAAVLGIVAIITLAGFVCLVFAGVFGEIPSEKELGLIKNPVASEVLAADGTVLGRYYIENRTNATADEIPLHLLDALVATEDVRIYRHNGFDMRAYLRVLVK